MGRNASELHAEAENYADMAATSASIREYDRAAAEAATSQAYSALALTGAVGRIIELIENRQMSEEPPFEIEQLLEKLDAIGEPLSDIAASVSGIERSTRN